MGQTSLGCPETTRAVGRLRRDRSVILCSLVLCALATGASISACGSSGGAHLSDGGPFDFAYDHDAGATEDALGTTIGEGIVTTGTIGRWDMEPHAFTRSLHVRPPGQVYGTGDGSTWTNALAGLPLELARGTKYYLASGEYYDGPWSDRYFHHGFDEPLDGEKYIGVVKAIVSDHGSDDGWDASFASGPSRLGPIALLTGYLVIDGQEGTGGDGSSYGIAISSRDCSDRRDGPVTFPWNSTATNVSLRHVNIKDCGHRTDPTNGSEDAIYSYTGGLTRFALKDSFVHDAFRRLMMLQRGTDVLIEGNTLARAGLHHEAGTLCIRDCRDVAIRRNVLVDSYGTFISLQSTTNAQIHGNVVRRELADWDVWATITMTDGTRDVRIYNNTLSRLTGLNVGIRGDSASNVWIVNNLWASNRTNQIMLQGTHDHNAFYDNYREETLLDTSIDESTKQVLTADPFVDGASGDVRLAAPTEAGATLPEPYTTDLLGLPRGSDGVWDRGAYEYRP